MEIDLDYTNVETVAKLVRATNFTIRICYWYGKPTYATIKSVKVTPDSRLEFELENWIGSLVFSPYQQVRTTMYIPEKEVAE